MVVNFGPEQRQLTEEVSERINWMLDRKQSVGDGLAKAILEVMQGHREDLRWLLEGRGACCGLYHGVQRQVRLCIGTTWNGPMLKGHRKNCTTYYHWEVPGTLPTKELSPAAPAASEEWAVARQNVALRFFGALPKGKEEAAPSYAEDIGCGRWAERSGAAAPQEPMASEEGAWGMPAVEPVYQ